MRATPSRAARILVTGAAVLLLVPGVVAAGGHGAHGHGHHGGHAGHAGSCPRPEPGCRADGGAPGAQAEEAWASDHDLFRFLLDHREVIARTVTPLENGVATVTETDDEAVRAALRAHAASMRGRVEEGPGIHLRDPLFAELFRNADRITMHVEPTERGVRVVETSDDPGVAALIRAHAEVVTAFLANGHAEVRKNHPVPGAADADL